MRRSSAALGLVFSHFPFQKRCPSAAVFASVVAKIAVAFREQMLLVVCCRSAFLAAFGAFPSMVVVADVVVVLPFVAIERVQMPLHVEA